MNDEKTKEEIYVPIGWQQFGTIEQLINAYKRAKEKPTLKTRYIQDDV